MSSSSPYPFLLLISYPSISIMSTKRASTYLSSFILAYLLFYFFLLCLTCFDIFVFFQNISYIILSLSDLTYYYYFFLNCFNPSFSHLYFFTDASYITDDYFGGFGFAIINSERKMTVAGCKRIKVTRDSCLDIHIAFTDCLELMLDINKVSCGKT